LREAVIVSAVRTPVGRCRGSLASVPAEELGALVIREAVKRASIDPSTIDEVLFGNIRNNDIRGMGRMAALAAGLPVSVPGITLERQCTSSLNAYAYASILIQAGFGDIMVSGGVESDSRFPYLMERTSGPYQVSPPRWSEQKSSPVDPYGNPNMGITAENIAEKYGITRVECDEFSLRSHQKATKAWESGYFDEQVIPVEVSAGKGKTLTVARDESVRADSSMETLSKLSPAFKKDGVVTAGNSSPMSDGAGALVVMEKEMAKSLGLEILGTFKGYASAGVDPAIMGIGPVASTKKLFNQTGLTMNDIDLIELNEAFASQSIACIRELKMDEDKVNVNGGAIAIGHPLAGSGAILIAKMVYELKRLDKNMGLISFCAAGGMGVSVVIERG